MEATNSTEPGLAARQWEPIFRKAGVLTSDLDAGKSQRGKDTKMGAFLSQNVGREVRVEVGGRSGTAKLCRKEERSRQRLYYFEVRWDKPDLSAGSEVPETQASQVLDDGLAAEPNGGTVEPNVAAATQEVPGSAQDELVTAVVRGNDEAW